MNKSPAMKKEFISFILIAILFSVFTNSCQQDNTLWIVTAPAYKEFTKVDKEGITVIPNGRFITPYGKTITTAPHPYGLALSPDNNIAVTANSGIKPLSITIIRDLFSEAPEVQQVPPGASTDEGVLASVFMGLAVAPDNKTIYVSGGQENKIYLFDAETGAKKGEIDCSFVSDDVDYSHGYIGDLTLTKDGKTLYAVDQIGFRMIVIDTENKKLKYSVPVGRYPFGICLSPDEKKAYVANVGMFRYAIIRRSDKKGARIKPVNLPVYAFGSEEMIKGINNDTIYVPPLGDPNVPESFSVFVIDVTDGKYRTLAKVKTGHLVGSMVEGIPAVGGSSPNSIAATDKYVFVSNGNNDNISVISYEKDTVIATIPLILDQRMRHFRGVIPFGVAVSPDQKRLYVAESGINAVAVIDAENFEVLGHIPAGWFPAKLKVSNDGKKLIVTNAKGYGSGPNGGKNFKHGPEGSYIGALMKGNVQIIDIPDDKTLKELTLKTIQNNYRFRKPDDPSFDYRKNNPIPLYPGAKGSPKNTLYLSRKRTEHTTKYWDRSKMPKATRHSQDTVTEPRSITRKERSLLTMLPLCPTILPLPVHLQ